MRIGLNATDLQGVSREPAVPSSATASQARSASAENGDGFPEDTVSISSLALRALQTPQIRQDQLDSLQQKVAEGRYELDPSAVAKAILSQ